MADGDKLDLILSKLEKLDTLESDMRKLENDMRKLEGNMGKLENGMRKLEGNMKDLDTKLDANVKQLGRRIANIELTLENETNRNIQLVVENFVELKNKLNHAIPVADKNLAYEVKVNYLMGEVDKLRKEVDEIKGKIA